MWEVNASLYRPRGGALAHTPTVFRSGIGLEKTCRAPPRASGSGHDLIGAWAQTEPWQEHSTPRLLRRDRWVPEWENSKLTLNAYRRRFHAKDPECPHEAPSKLRSRYQRLCAKATTQEYRVYHGYKGYRFAGKAVDRLPLTDFGQVAALYVSTLSLKPCFILASWISRPR